MGDLLSIDEVAELLRVPKGTLYQWRHRRKGPPARRVGRHLRYDEAAVQAWLRDDKAA
ncbi:helix-turn-helix domain-containing protein [Dactylosporangium sp. NPDC050588]|uniref:helix-turn-helix domain-containing protein n=1 Tax=Dactylosporangium sp. NPDC050588 TaxID=3157211 RepID=UPI0033F4FF23